MAASKDSVVDVHAVENAEFVPVPAGNQPQPQTVNLILASLGGQYSQEKNGDVAPRLEGYVPPSNRNGSDDVALRTDKAFRLHAIDTEGELGNFPRVEDPRDNDKAPDEWPASQKSESVASSKGTK